MCLRCLLRFQEWPQICSYRGAPSALRAPTTVASLGQHPIWLMHSEALARSGTSFSVQALVSRKSPPQEEPQVIDVTQIQPAAWTRHSA